MIGPYSYEIISKHESNQEKTMMRDGLFLIWSYNVLSIEKKKLKIKVTAFYFILLANKKN